MTGNSFQNLSNIPHVRPRTLSWKFRLLYLPYAMIRWVCTDLKIGMKIYWSLKSVPELSDLSMVNRVKVYRIAYRDSGGLSRKEIIWLGVAVGLGAMFGTLGISLCVTLIGLPVYSKMIERLRPTLLSVRHRLGLHIPPSVS